jgi:hypothetical protein
MTADTSNVIITTQVRKVGSVMNQHLASIKQTTTLTFEGDDVVVSFNIDPDSENHDQPLREYLTDGSTFQGGPAYSENITVVTNNKKVKKAFGVKLKETEFTFGSGLEKFNEILTAIK